MAKIKFDPEKDNVAAAALNAKAVMPDGSLLARTEIMAKLGLNPETALDAWLSLVACGSNAAALNFNDAETLVRNDVLDSAHLDVVRRASRAGPR